jgi:hypothetical protein
MANTATENKNGPLQNDRLLVCGMLVFYGFCMMGLIGAAFWWLNQRNQSLSASATATTVAAVTQQANATATRIALATQQSDLTATAVARIAEQDQYEFIERFDDSSNAWLLGPENDEYWRSQISIQDGVYIWDVEEVKQTFVYWADFDKGNKLRDFDVYVDTKFVEAPEGGACSGFVFRKASTDWEEGAFTLSVCNDSHLEIYYYAHGDWEPIVEWKYSEAIYPTDWNRIEISARKNKFTFIINHVVVYDMVDDRRALGGLAILFEAKETAPMVVWFDNFGYQQR